MLARWLAFALGGKAVGEFFTIICDNLLDFKRAYLGEEPCVPFAVLLGKISKSPSGWLGQGHEELRLAVLIGHLRLLLGRCGELLISTQISNKLNVSTVAELVHIAMALDALQGLMPGYASHFKIR